MIKRYANYLLFISLNALLYLLLIHRAALAPLTGYEIYPWNDAVNLLARGAGAISSLIHPTLYTHILALSMKLFGVNELSARLFGIVNFCVIMGLIALITKSFRADKDGGILPAFIGIMLLSVNAAAVNGSLLIDFSDTTLLTTFIILFHLLYGESRGLSPAKRILLLGAAFAFCLWGKVTTNLVLPLSVLVFCLIGGKIKEGILTAFLFPLIGAALFTATWFLYCKYVALQPGQFLAPLKYVFISLFPVGPAVRTGTSKLHIIAAGVFRDAIWFNIFFIALTLTAFLDNAYRYFKYKTFSDENLLFISGFLISAVYIYIEGGSVAGGFPKYLVPAYPLFCCYNGIFAARVLKPVSTGTSKLWLLYFTLCLVFYFFFLGDSVYVTHQVKLLYSRSAGLGPIKAYLKHYMLLYFAVPAVFTAVMLLRRASGRSMLTMLLITIFALNLSTVLTQMTAPYLTGMDYGTEGAYTLRYFYRRTPVIYTTTEGKMANCPHTIFVNIAIAVWDNPVKLSEYIVKFKPAVLVYGTACNSVFQLRYSVNTPEVSSVLNKYYHKYDLGSYTVSYLKLSGKPLSEKNDRKM